MLVDITKSSSTVTNQRARLLSPVIMPNGEQCIEFWYYSDAEPLSTASQLKVFIRNATQSTNTSGYIVWSKNILKVNYIRINNQ